MNPSLASSVSCAINCKNGLRLLPRDDRGSRYQRGTSPRCLRSHTSGSLMKALNKTLLTIVITMVLATTHTSFASADSSTTEDQLVQAYIAADYETLVGDSKIAEALGLGKEAVALAAAAQALKDGGTKDSGGSMGKADKAIDAAKSVMEAALKKAATNLVGPAKVTYAEGLLHLGRGVQGTMKLKAAAIAFGRDAQAQIKAATLAKKMAVMQKLTPGTYVATHIVGHISNVLNGLKLAVAFGQSHGVAIPPDATAALNPV